MKVTPNNAQHIGRRQEQQDAFGFSDPKNKRLARHGGLLAIIADGMGGMQMGGEASKTAVVAFLKAYEGKSAKTSIADALQKSLHAANQAVLKLGRKNGEVGTTLIAAVIAEDSLYWVSTGDSRIYLLRDGELIQLTADHTYANELVAEVARGRMSRSEILSQTGLEDLTSYLGLAELKEIDRNLRPFPLQDGDRVLLCSDGLYKSLSDEEIVMTLERQTTKPCEVLLNQALEKQLFNQDNVTVLTLSCAQDSQRFAARNKKFILSLIGLLVALAVTLIIWWKVCKAPEPVTQQPPVATDANTPMDAAGVKEELHKQATEQKPKPQKSRKKPLRHHP